MSRRRAGALVAVLVTLVSLLDACALPYQRRSDDASKIAVTPAAATEVYARYTRVRRVALRLLDPQPLTSIETGPVLAIDAGALRVARLLPVDESVEPGPDLQDLQILQVLAPRLGAYPLWFVAVVRDGVRGLIKVQIFTRRTSVSTWQLVASPETLPSVRLPRFAVDAEGALTPVEPDDDAGLPLSPTAAVQTYVDTLNATAAGQPGTPGPVVRDSFVTQMAAIARRQSAIEGVRFAQQWRAAAVRYALRTADGGALVFADLLRVDAYALSPGTTVSWPAGSEQKAFLRGKLFSGGQLSYLHQVLLYLPAQGGRTRAIGQYGGVVDASGV